MKNKYFLDYSKYNNIIVSVIYSIEVVKYLHLLLSMICRNTVPRTVLINNYSNLRVYTCNGVFQWVC